jgi:hypothetical protein
MKEYSIVESGPMVRAILEGRKTQTRRIVKPQPRQVKLFPYPMGGVQLADESGDPHWAIEHARKSRRWAWPVDEAPCVPAALCPYGAPGDRLWVRETWGESDSDGGPVIVYKAGGHMVRGATGSKRLGTWADEIFPGEVGEVYPPERWRSSIHMPRWASRITLELTAVRVERIQDISEADARAEGCEQSDVITMDDAKDLTGDHKRLLESFVGGRFTAKMDFVCLWHAINAKRAPWESNPWCWVLEFKRIMGANAA